MLDGMLSLQRYVMDASGNTVPKDAENTIYRKSTTETCVTVSYTHLQNLSRRFLC